MLSPPCRSPGAGCWVKPGWTGAPKSKSYSPENAQIDPALKLFTGVGSPFPARSPPNALPAPTPTTVTAHAATAAIRNLPIIYLPVDDGAAEPGRETVFTRAELPQTRGAYDLFVPTCAPGGRRRRRRRESLGSCDGWRRLADVPRSACSLGSRRAPDVPNPTPIPTLSTNRALGRVVPRTALLGAETEVGGNHAHLAQPRGYRRHRRCGIACWCGLDLAEGCFDRAETIRPRPMHSNRWRRRGVAT